DEIAIAGGPTTRRTGIRAVDALLQRDLALAPRIADEPTLVLLDRDVVDARLSAAHETVVGELPELVAVRPMPSAGSVMPLVLEAHRDPPLAECPEALTQPVVELPLPLAPQEVFDRGPALDKLVPVPPHGILRVR